MKSSRIIGAAAVLAVATASLPASAALGSAPTYNPGASTITLSQNVAAASASGTSGTTQVTRMAQQISATGTAYTVNETTLEGGTVVREYVASSGAVFAIAWHGPIMAPLNTLLGTYFPNYMSGLSAVHALHPGTGSATVQQSDLVVETGGHMRSYVGRAWLPLALPQGFSEAEIQ
jgi:hypothetical protein